jgi:uncharacterized protein with HEPN domain
MSRHDDSVYLRHLRDNALTAISLAQGKQRRDLDGDLTLRYALLHAICITGEAANRVSPEGKITYAAIPWKPLIGIRNRLIHGYDIVDWEIVWKTVTEDFPILLETLNDCLREENGPG